MFLLCSTSISSFFNFNCATSFYISSCSALLFSFNSFNLFYNYSIYLSLLFIILCSCFCSSFFKFSNFFFSSSILLWLIYWALLEPFASFPSNYFSALACFTYSSNSTIILFSLLISRSKYFLISFFFCNSS